MTKVVRLHATGPVETFQYSDLPGFYPEATIVGAPPQWDDGSDATWGRSQTDNASTDFRSLMAQLGPLPTAVTADKVLSITAHLRFDTAHPAGETSRIYQFAIYDDAHRTSADSPVYQVGSRAPDFPDPPDDDLIHEVDYNIYPIGAEFLDLPALVSAFHAGAWFNPSTVMPNPWKRSALTVYEAWIDVEIAADSAVRQYPRDDTLGLGNVARLYPPPRSGRMFGGQP